MEVRDARVGPRRLVPVVPPRRRKRVARRARDFKVRGGRRGRRSAPLTGRVRAVHGRLEWTLRFGMDRRTATRLAKEATDDLFAVLADDATAFGLVELRAANATAATSTANARDDIRASGEWYSWLLEERRIGCCCVASARGGRNQGRRRECLLRGPRSCVGGAGVSGSSPRRASALVRRERARVRRRGPPQEVALSGVRLTNRGRAPARVFDSETGDLALRRKSRLRPDSRVPGPSYVARAEEFARGVLERGGRRGRRTYRPDRRGAELRPRVRGRGVRRRASDYGGTVSIGFEIVAQSPVSSTASCAAGASCRARDGVAAPHALAGVRRRDREWEPRTGRARSRSSLIAARFVFGEGGRVGRVGFAAARAPRRRRRRVRVRGGP